MSCLRGTCVGTESRTQFSLYDARDGRGIWPEFIAPKRVKPGAEVTLKISNIVFRLRNTFKSPQFYLFVQSEQDATRVLNALTALEAENKNGKFSVEDGNGKSYSFTVRGVTESMKRMQRRCEPR